MWTRQQHGHTTQPSVEGDRVDRPGSGRDAREAGLKEAEAGVAVAKVRLSA